MAKLQTALRGFSSFIGRFTGGNVGLQDSSVLVPTIAMEDFLNERKNQSFQTNFTSPDQYSSITVPDGKRWRIHSASAAINPTLDEQAIFEIVFAKKFGSTQYIGSFSAYGPFAATALTWQNNPAFGLGMSRGIHDMDLVLDGGDEIGVAVNLVAGTGPNWNISFFTQYTEWQI